MLTHLVAPSSSAGAQSSDAYLLLDIVCSGLTVNWVGAGARLRSRLSTDTVTMLADDLQQLSATLKHLVAVVDRSVQRVPLDRIAYPCYGCQDRTCQSPRFGRSVCPDDDDGHATAVIASRHDHGDGGHSVYEDADNSIPHIDSDPEDSTQDRHRAVVDNDGGECT